MRVLGFAVIGSVALATATPAQRATLSVRKVHSVVDQDGQAFGGLPRYVTPLPGGRFLVTEDGGRPQSPMIVDSAGKVMRALGVVGDGPGEVDGFPGPARVGIRDSVFYLTAGHVNVYSPQLRFVRSVRPATGAFDMLEMPSGFVAARAQGSANSIWTPFHILDRAGKTVRSFGRDSARRPVEYELMPSSAGAFWALARGSHRFERWTSAGQRTHVIDFSSKWWKAIKPGAPEPFTTVRAFREVGGVLWALSMVPVPDIREVMRAAGQSTPTSDGRGPRLPMEKMYTTVVEAYEISSGKQIAELSMPGAPVSVIDDQHIVIYDVGVDDLPRLEFWEIKLKR